MPTNVLLLPAIELHKGIHGGLLEQPPPGVVYSRAFCEHEYLIDQASAAAFDPLQQFALAEVVHATAPDGERCLLHTSRVPAYGSLPWVVDADCLLATLFYGRDLLFGRGGRIAEEQVPPVQQRRRLRLMLAHYLDPACYGILFRTDHRRKLFLETVLAEQMLSSAQRRRLNDLCDVVYPAVQPLDPNTQLDEQPLIIYTARTTEGKGGAVAAAVFARLASSYQQPLRMLWIGPLPEDVQALPEQVERLPVLPRKVYLQLLAPGRIFFSPTNYESFGMGLIEAAAHGMPIVTARGPGMEHIEELFEDKRHALLIDNQLPRRQRIEAYCHALIQLLENLPKRQRFVAENLSLCHRGKLSLAARDEKLCSYYQQMDQGYDQIVAGSKQRMQSLRSQYSLQSHFLTDLALQARYAARRRHTPGRIRIS